MYDSGRRCEKCGYNLTGLTEPRCPECGTDQLEYLRCRSKTKTVRCILNACCFVSAILSTSTIWTMLRPAYGIVFTNHAGARLNVVCFQLPLTLLGIVTCWIGVAVADDNKYFFFRGVLLVFLMIVSGIFLQL